ncbi:MAG: 4Fe-4S binding protein [Bacteroidota bacterium]
MENLEIPVINTAECIACEACVTICPFEIISMENGKAKIDNEKCNKCRICLMACPVGAIQ